MSGKGKDEATFRINIAGNAAAASKEVASSVRNAAQAIQKYENDVKDLSAEYRKLRGNSDDVVATKKDLKAKIEAAKASISSLTVDIRKSGVSYKEAAEAAKKYKEATGVAPNLRAGLGKAGSAVASGLGSVAKKAGAKLAPLGKKLGDFAAPLTARVAPLAKKLGAKLAPLGATFKKIGSAVKQDFGSVIAKVGPMLGEVLAGGAALGAAAVVAVGAAFVAAGVALAAFSLATADANAKLMRQREALLGTAKDAGNLGDQIAALTGKVPQGTAELSSMAHQLNKTRISGKATVDALAAIAQVSGAVDDAAGAKIQELITRNDKFGRMAIGMFELDGTGLDFDDVAKAYAEGTKKSLDAARKELRFGVAPIEAGSEALRKAAEKKFGKLNIANAFSLENAPKKFMDQFRELSKDVNLGPISEALKDAFGQLSPNAPLGSSVKMFMTTFGGGLVEIAAKGIPLVLEGFKYMIGGGLRLAAVFIETKTAISEALSGDNFFESAKGVGLAIAKGWAKGLAAGYGTIFEAVKGLGADTIKAFKDVMGIHSPSRVFAKLGEHTTEGYALGVERGSSRASDAVQSMVDMPTPAAPAAMGSFVWSGDLVIQGMPTDEAEKMRSPETEAMIMRAVRNAFSGAGAMG